MTLERSRTYVDLSDIDPLLGNFAAQSGAGTSFAITQPAATETLGSIVWNEAEGTYTAHGVAYMLIGLVTDNEGKGFLFFYDAPTDSFTTAPDSVCKTVLLSLTFLQ